MNQRHSGAVCAPAGLCGASGACICVARARQHAPPPRAAQRSRRKQANWCARALRLLAPPTRWAARRPARGRPKSAHTNIAPPATPSAAHRAPLAPRDPVAQSDFDWQPPHSHSGWCLYQLGRPDADRPQLQTHATWGGRRQVRTRRSCALPLN